MTAWDPDGDGPAPPILIAAGYSFDPFPSTEGVARWDPTGGYDRGPRWDRPRASGASQG
jgi:hypothetical protein